MPYAIKDLRDIERSLCSHRRILEQTTILGQFRLHGLRDERSDFNGAIV